MMRSAICATCGGGVRIDCGIDHGAAALALRGLGLSQVCDRGVPRIGEQCDPPRRGGDVMVTVTEVEGRIEIRVRDDGQGIDPAATAGLGSAMLDDTCMQRELPDLAGGATELVAIPV